MSSSTWTPHAVASSAREFDLRLWRAVEAQHVASTRRLVDSVDEQLALERLLEAAKPPLPESLREAHYLVSTPFRYPSPFGSRFRAPHDPGAFYGAEQVRTACAELGYWRWRFLLDSDGPHSLGPSPQTLFRIRASARGIDLRVPPYDSDVALWTHPSDYSATQALARAAREAPVGLIRYRSVRDPRNGACAVVLDPEAFRALRPTSQQTWFLTVLRAGVTWQREGVSHEFPATLPGWSPA